MLLISFLRQFHVYFPEGYLVCRINAASYQVIFSKYKQNCRPARVMATQSTPAYKHVPGTSNKKYIHIWCINNALLD